MDISKNVFIPKPNIDSIVVEFSKKEEQEKIDNLDLFFKLVRESFKQKRKTIKNNLMNYDLKVVEKVLSANDMDLAVRAEKLSTKIFVEIANELNK